MASDDLATRAMNDPRAHGVLTASSYDEARRIANSGYAWAAVLLGDCTDDGAEFLVATDPDVAFALNEGGYEWAD